MDTPAPITGYGPHVYFSGAAGARKTRTALLSGGCKLSQPAENTAGLMAFLFAEAGLDVSRYRAAALERRHAACLRALGASHPEHAQKILQNKPERLAAAIDSVLLGVTDFFRDRDVFEGLGNSVLPQILATTARPRIWSAACSSGQELYSVALMLEHAGALEVCELLGTDLRPEALRLAVRARFPVPSGDGLNGCRLHRRGNHVEIPEHTRRRIRWARRDLFRSAEQGPWDLILWRNMAIYLTPDAAQEVWQRLATELKPGGFLISGKAERPPRGLGLERIAPSIYRKHRSEGTNHAL
jgi:chemotaxis methyl-accepting protein methylase